MKRRDVMAASAAMFGVALAPGAETKIAPLPPRSLADRDPEAYWRKIRDEQFLLPGWRSFLNNGSLGVAPRAVVAAVARYLSDSAGLLVEGYPRWGYETMDQHRDELARFIGCKREEVALMHNATEAMSTVAAGLDLKPGDEVLMTDQEHPSGRAGWRQKEARFGVSVREIKIPLPPKSPGQLIDLLISSIGPRTRVLSFSGITSPTGLLMPVKEICAAARAKGVITVCDGAHMHGQTPVRLSDLGCDFFSGSPHKWMFAPAGCGFLYIREEMLDRLWPLCVTGEWDNKELKAARFMRMGTNNRAIFEGLVAGIRFAEAIGPERIYARNHQMARRILERAQKCPHVELLTPDDDRMFASLVSIRFKKDPAPVWEECRKRKIFISPGERVRISAHIHTRPRDIDEFFEVIERKVNNG